MSAVDSTREWLETDGLGGFASGTVDGRRTRRYHALLLTATTPPTGRYVLVNGIEAFVTTSAGLFALSTQQYVPNVVHPDGHRHIQSFTDSPWPAWTYELPDRTRIVQELFVPNEKSAIVMQWRRDQGTGPVSLTVRPLVSGRDYHALHHENDGFQFTPTSDGERHAWHPYNGVPGVALIGNGAYEHRPLWYRQFLYEQEAERGLDCTEDLASPGAIRFDLAAEEAVLVLSTEGPNGIQCRSQETAVSLASRLAGAERLRRGLFPSRLHRSANAYLVRRGTGKTIIAGYPWFTDWGRDTFIALRGLCLATGRLDDAEQILVDWAGTVSEGMLPNRFPDHGEAPEFNSVDASLWYVVAVHEFLQAAESMRRRLTPATIATLDRAVDQILEGYSAGTRFGIQADNDGLLRAGVPGVQLTWMDAKVGDWVVTPRIGKPVEVQALWLNALWIGGPRSSRWRTLYTQGRAAFQKRFWNTEGGGLYDVVDADHEPGRTDDSVRPNQILAVGGLPLTLLDRMEAGRVLEIVEQQLWTPLGLRSLAPGSPGYSPRNEGGVRQRDGAYHQGTVWPWLIGPFVEAWLRVHGTTPETIAEAKRRFIAPLLQHLEEAGLGHVSEIADAEPPHTPRGCPFQAWSLGELLRLQSILLEDAREADPVNALMEDFIPLPPHASGHAADLTSAR